MGREAKTEESQILRPRRRWCHNRQKEPGWGWISVADRAKGSADTPLYRVACSHHMDSTTLYTPLGQFPLSSLTRRPKIHVCRFWVMTFPWDRSHYLIGIYLSNGFCNSAPCFLWGSFHLHFKTYIKHWRGLKGDCGAEATQCGLVQSPSLVLSLTLSGRQWTFLPLFWPHFPHPGTVMRFRERFAAARKVADCFSVG